MVSTGSKFFFGMAVTAFLGAIVYGIATTATGVGATLTGGGAIDAIIGPLTFGYKGGIGDHVGYVVLMAFAFSCGGLGLATSLFRDADPSALAQIGDGSVPAIPRPQALSFWPAITALAGAIVVIGLATSSTLFVVGIILGLIAVFEWTVTAWADSVSGDAETNRAVRSRLMAPIEFPVGAVLGIAVVVLLLSRIFLALPKNGSIIAASALAALFFVVGVLLASRPQLRRSILVVTLLVIGLLVLGLGLYGGIKGSRTFEKKSGAETSAPANDPAGALQVGETS